MNGRALVLAGVLLLAACGTPRSSMSLEELYRESRSEAFGGKGAWSGIEETRRERIDEVLRRLGNGTIESPGERLFAAAILLDSEDWNEADLASELALSAAEDGDERGFPVAAEAIDRGLMLRGRPQRYGTQFLFDQVNAKWILYEWDPATTDVDRAAMGVPTLADALARLRRLNSFRETP